MIWYSSYTPFIPDCFVRGYCAKLNIWRIGLASLSKRGIAHYVACTNSSKMSLHFLHCGSQDSVDKTGTCIASELFGKFNGFIDDDLFWRCFHGEFRQGQT